MSALRRSARRFAALLAALLCAALPARAQVSPTTGREVPAGRFLPVLVSVANGYGTVRVNGKAVTAAGAGSGALWGAQQADIVYESLLYRDPDKAAASTRLTLLFSDALLRGEAVSCGPVRSLRDASASLREEWQGALAFMSPLGARYQGEAVERLKTDASAAFDIVAIRRGGLGRRLQGVKAPSNLSVDVNAIQACAAADSNARPFAFAAQPAAPDEAAAPDDGIPAAAADNGTSTSAADTNAAPDEGVATPVPDTAVAPAETPADADNGTPAPAADASTAPDDSATTPAADDAALTAARHASATAPAADDPAPAAPSLTLDWGDARYLSRFVWDGAAGGYLRQVAGWPFACYPAAEARMAGDESAMVRPAYANVIVQWVRYDALSPTLQNPALVGRGAADLFVGGRHVRGTWERKSPDARTVFRDASGREAALSPGRTWIALFPADAALAF